MAGPSEYFDFGLDVTVVNLEVKDIKASTTHQELPVQGQMTQTSSHKKRNKLKLKLKLKYRVWIHFEKTEVKDATKNTAFKAQCMFCKDLYRSSFSGDTGHLKSN